MIHVEREGPRVTITLNRPDKANALTREMLASIAQAVEVNADARALVLTGAGKVFCAGMDLAEAETGLPTDPVWSEASEAIAGFQGLSIAALNGTLAGGAFALGLACDLRLAVPTAKFFYPVMRLGFRPQPHDPARLRNLIGPARAKMILMAGEKITAEEALGYGLIDRIVEPDAMAETLERMTEGVCAASEGHLRAIKGMIDG